MEDVETKEEEERERERERERTRCRKRVKETHLQTDLDPSALVKYTFPVWV